MKSSVTKDFRKRLSNLPNTVQAKADKAYALWKTDPYHRSVQFKQVSQRQPIYSVRIDLSYRALGLIEEGQIYWFWIGPHSEYDALLKRL